jgi:hypothetical protein
MDVFILQNSDHSGLLSSQKKFKLKRKRFKGMLEGKETTMRLFSNSREKKMLYQFVISFEVQIIKYFHQSKRISCFFSNK